MIFSGDLCDKVLAGTKTQTRRPVIVYNEFGSMYACRYVVGRTYAIQRKRGTPGLGPRLRVRGISRVHSGFISDEDARAEGFDSPGDFYERWESFYGDGKPWCWRIEFTLEPTTAAPSGASAPPKDSDSPVAGDTRGQEHAGGNDQGKDSVATESPSESSKT